MTAALPTGAIKGSAARNREFTFMLPVVHRTGRAWSPERLRVGRTARAGGGGTTMPPPAAAVPIFLRYGRSAPPPTQLLRRAAMRDAYHEELDSISDQLVEMARLVG